jgi:hypothetical protein
MTGGPFALKSQLDEHRRGDNYCGGVLANFVENTVDSDVLRMSLE